jgi:hypothetical protein
VVDPLHDGSLWEAIHATNAQVGRSFSLPHWVAQCVEWNSQQLCDLTRVQQAWHAYIVAHLFLQCQRQVSASDKQVATTVLIRCSMLGRITCPRSRLCRV